MRKDLIVAKGYTGSYHETSFVSGREDPGLRPQISPIRMDRNNDKFERFSSLHTARAVDCL